MLRAIRVLSVTIGLFALCACSKKEAPPPKAAGGGMPVVPVTAIKVLQQAVPTELRVVGTVEASAIVQVKSQIAGELTSVNFTEGQNVAKGQLLFHIDSRPYQDAVAQAEAAIERDKAQVTQAEASLARDKAQANYAATDAALQSELNKGGLTSKSQVDQSRSNADAAKASASATQATIESAKAAQRSDQAALETAKLNLSYCEITAPISGRTGNLLVHAGNLVKVNDAALVIIHQVSPIFVDFSVPEQHLSAIRRLSASHKLAVRVFSQDDPGRAAEGSLSVIDNTVDSTTGTIHLKATFENRDGMLWPGQFVTAVLTLDTIRNAAVVPSVAVQNGQQGSFVFQVKPDNTVAIKPVTLGRSFGDKVVIESGVAPGDTVVTDGALILFPGATVKLVDAPKLGTGGL
ncbi:MAG TPA: efflux RND transporter periplasmic adaptor subunit [Bryobacteraceae bacterium]|jgi:multidrug efflux system membrane fusion protein|nr:efflux RND transporter periplasmic adaptor subunit [Bryobacteraceae bacterium]